MIEGLPEPVALATAALFAAIPFESSMPQLVGLDPKHQDLVESALSDPALRDRPDLAAALWLYVDDLNRSHTVSQSIDNDTGSYWHGIMHRREGDFSNSHYWMRRASTHPLRTARLDLDPDDLIDAVQAAHGANPAQLVERQRSEWMALFTWCAQNRSADQVIPKP